MLKNTCLLVLAVGAATVNSRSATSAVSVGGASFVDLGAVPAGQSARPINFGAPRGSIGVIDFDRDGYIDVFFNTNPGAPKRLFRNVADPLVSGGRGFVDVSTSTGIGSDTDLTSRSAGTVVVFDYNNDGFDDIYTGGFASGAAGVLMRNNGNGTFTNVSAAANARNTPGVTIDCASAGDVNHDGYLDLFICNLGSSAQTFTLLLNNADGTFSNRSDLVTQPGHGGRIYAGAFADFDRDGWDEYVALLSNGVGLVLRNEANPSGGRRFVGLAPAVSGMTFLGPAPMGIAVGDYDGDGWLDLAITDAASGTYYRNNNGVLSRVFPFSTFFGWGTTWIDTTNKGRLDNYQAGSFGSSNVDRLFLNNAGTWTDARDALNTTSLPSQHCARVDFDNDGLEDIITNNPGSFVSVYRNAAVTNNHWLKVALEAEAAPAGSARLSNPRGIGAWVRVTAGGQTHVRQVQSGTSFGASEDPRAHFGLGSSTTIDRIEVVWPRAGTMPERTQVLAGPITADQTIVISSGACRADVDDSGRVDLTDLFGFLDGWFALQAQTGSGLSADFDGNDRVDVVDLFDYLDAWFAQNGVCG